MGRESALSARRDTNQPERTMNTDTPRTDEWLEEEKRNPRLSGLGNWLDYCKQLERELTSVTEQRDGLQSGIEYASDQLHKVTEQRDKAWQKIENQAERITYLEGATNHATGTPLSKAIEQRDKLIKAIEPLEYWRDISECDCSNPLPQGGCLRCDLERILKLTNPNEL